MRKQRIALIDPINGVAYSRPGRKNNRGYQEDCALQQCLDERGLPEARRFASRHYQGVVVAVLVD